MNLFKQAFLITGIFLVVSSADITQAQMSVGGGGGSGGGTYALEEDESNLKFAGIPIPSYSDVMGFGLGVVGMAYYKLDRHDDDLPPSSSGLFGFYSENSSWVGGLFQKVHYDEDKWRGTLALGSGSVKYQFNPTSIHPDFPNTFLDYTTVTNFVYVTGSRQTWNNLYLGVEALTWSAQVSVDPSLVELPDQRFSGPGVTAEWDKRDHIMYPTAGVLVSSRYTFFDQAFGSDRDFRKLKLSLSGYQAMGDSTRVLAGRCMLETSHGDVPFSGETIVNGNQNLRGYSNGAHRGNNLLMMEAEYRWNFWNKWGLAVFSGAAFVSNELSEMSLRDILPAAGFGLRWRIIETYKINARIDMGWGKDDHGIYFSIGEAY